jgi:hypothetical protein
MIGHAIGRFLPLNRISSRLRVGSWTIDVVCATPADRHESQSGLAARLAEELVAAGLDLPREAVRVAGMPPSGRPVAMVHGVAVGMAVSLSHVRGVAGAAASAQASIGIDIVDPAEAGRELDAFFTPDELALAPDDDGLLRGLLWSAKEAAFKAARLDVGFCPRAVAIESLVGNGFEWTVSGPHRLVSGAGSFAWAGRHIVAIAAAPMPATVVRSGIRRVMAAPTPAA